MIKGNSKGLFSSVICSDMVWCMFAFELDIFLLKLGLALIPQPKAEEEI
jgi:hypothetical protein